MLSSRSAGTLLLLFRGCIAALPLFSWNTVPVFWHAANSSGPFSDAAVDFIARSGFASATLEKSQGLDGPGNTTTFAEERILAAARQLKTANADLPVVAYFNSVLNWPYYRLAASLAMHPSWALQNVSGHPVLLHGDPSFPQPPEGMDVFDFSQTVVQAWFATACSNLTATGALDGCFEDRAGEEGFPGITPATAAAYARGHDAVLRSLQAAVGTNDFIIANNYALPGIRATMLESFNASEGAIEELQALVAAGFIVQAHAGYTADGADNHCASVVNSLAAFLIGAGEGSYFACSRDWQIDPEWPAPGHASDWMTWHPEYSRPLGTPTGPGQRSAAGIWTRAFALGTQVEFDAHSGIGTITWAHALNSTGV